MTLADFKQYPWKNSHPAYKESAFAISPAPEYASSEVLLSSLYRTIGMDDASEGSVPQAGREISKRLQRFRDRHQKPSGATVDANAWHALLHGIMESPKLPNQSSKRFVQVSPLVPGAARFSGSARLSSNSWPAGNFIRRMAWLGSETHSSAASLWSDLFDALDVGAKDDVFARWLQEEIATWSDASPSWHLQVPAPSEVATLAPGDLRHVQYPARQFTRDLRSIIQVKNCMTRRQWTTLLEAVLRLGAVSHLTWLCDVNDRIWRCLSSALTGNGPSHPGEVRQAIFPSRLQYMSYGDKALPAIKDRASSYLLARLGINAVLWSLDEARVGYQGSLSSSYDITMLCDHVRENADAISNVAEVVNEVTEREARALLCKKGIGSNLMEFARHALGQRQTASTILRGYDQGYVLKKRGSNSSSPWVVSLGPVSVLALVHCALAEMGGPRSIHQLSLHLSAYGIVVDRHDIARNDLGNQLRMLGLVLDSPDAESGMLLLPPFNSSPVAAREILK